MYSSSVCSLLPNVTRRATRLPDAQLFFLITPDDYEDHGFELNGSVRFFPVPRSGGTRQGSASGGAENSEPVVIVPSAAPKVIPPSALPKVRPGAPPPNPKLEPPPKDGRGSAKGLPARDCCDEAKGLPAKDVCEAPKVE